MDQSNVTENQASTKQNSKRKTHAAEVPFKVRAKALAAKCEDSYSFDRYRSWPACAEKLLRLGLSEDDAEIVLRSKWMRWAADGSDADYGRVPASVIEEYVKQHAGELRPHLGVRWMPKP